MTKSPLAELRQVVEETLKKNGKQLIDNADLDPDEADEYVWISWGKIEGYSVAEFDALSVEGEELLFANAKKISENLSEKLVVIHEGSATLHYREFLKGEIVLSWSEMMGPEDGKDSDFDWLEAYIENLIDTEEGLEIESFLEGVLTERLGFAREFRDIYKDFKVISWVENEKETAWYGDD